MGPKKLAGWRTRTSLPQQADLTDCPFASLVVKTSTLTRAAGTEENTHAALPGLCCYQHCHQCILTSQINSFIYDVSILIFYTVELNTDFANIYIGIFDRHYNQETNLICYTHLSKTFPRYL